MKFIKNVDYAKIKNCIAKPGKYEGVAAPPGFPNFGAWIAGAAGPALAKGYKYVIIRPYGHQYKFVPVANPALTFPFPATPFVTLPAPDRIALEIGYCWNGPDIVCDTPGSMRASAIHDAWCQLMANDTYQAGKKNRRRGGGEYKRIYKQDGWNVCAYTQGFFVRNFGCDGEK